jgi:acyl-CoA synthetase (AMP-forming)/AMP-acid ligase II
MRGGGGGGAAVRTATIQRWLLRAAGDPGTGLRFVDGAERERFVGWPEIAARAARTAGGLAALGVAPGERVALVFATGLEFFDGFFGTLFCGAVPVPLYPPVRLGRLEEYRARTAAMLEAVDAALVVGDRRLLPLVGEAVAAARGRCLRLGARTLESLPPAPPRTHEGAADELALVQFSSGTTVEPKPVALEQRAVTAQVEILNALWPDDHAVTHSGVSWLPLYHDMGLIGTVLPAVERPATLTLIPPERFVGRPALWLRALARHRATISVAPNFAYALATERVADDELAGCDLSAWRIALCGAETISAASLRAFAARFARFGFRAEALTPVYGLSEASLAVTFSALDRPPVSRVLDRTALARDRRAIDAGTNAVTAVPAAGGVERVSVGRPLAGFALELRDRAGRPVAEGEVGRLYVRGPSLFREYLGRPEATARVLVDGWLDTGDLGFLDSGELYLVGRAKDVLIVRGQNHAPEEVERAVDAVAAARRGCAAALSHRPDGEPTDRLLLVVEHRRGAGASDRIELSRRAREAVLGATGLALDEVVVVAPGTLPRTSSGKIRRGETLARHLAGELAAPARVGPLALARAFWRGRRALGRGRRGR